jgi:hypothetical protein
MHILIWVLVPWFEKADRSGFGEFR